MKPIRAAKYLSVTVFALVVAVGCATAPKEQAASTAQSSGQATTQALAQAKAAIAKMNALHWGWTGPGKLMKKAEAAAANGNDAKAQKLAKQAQLQAEAAVNQYYLEKAKWMMESISRASGLNAEQQTLRKEAAAAIHNVEGKKAYDLLSRLSAQLKATMNYKVVRGDSLWRIAGRSSVYHNPYEWPLIYLTNASKIHDADLIYPGQVFNIERNPTTAQVDAAVHHAKTRGSWSLGKVEPSDRAYLKSQGVR